MNNDALEVRAMETKLGNAPGKIEGLRDIEPDADVIVGSYSSNVVNTMMLGLKHRTNDRHPAEGWMKQIARNMTLYGGDCLRAAGTCCMTGTIHPLISSYHRSRVGKSLAPPGAESEPQCPCPKLCPMATANPADYFCGASVRAERALDDFEEWSCPVHFSFAALVGARLPRKNTSFVRKRSARPARIVSTPSSRSS
jgi:hypothetical protein